MASTGGGAARSGKKRNPDVADPEEASQAELVGTVGTMESVERKVDLLVTTISARLWEFDRVKEIICLFS